MKNRIPVTLAACIPLVSCQTTGDPNQGGYFGWSQSKFDQRANVLRSELSVLERSSGELGRDQKQLRAEHQRLTREIGRLERSRQSASSPNEKERIDQDLARTKSELRRLEQQAGFLQGL
ncbi:MAG TPA: hypothetical protein VLO11_07730 [Luteolibacter sp.]|nr:hypothetical protein [Luteolibacter sp.]